MNSWTFRGDFCVILAWRSTEIPVAEGGWNLMLYGGKKKRIKKTILILLVDQPDTSYSVRYSFPKRVCSDHLSKILLSFIIFDLLKNFFSCKMPVTSPCCNPVREGSFRIPPLQQFSYCLLQPSSIHEFLFEHFPFTSIDLPCLISLNVSCLLPSLVGEIHQLKNFIFLILR